MNMVLRPFIAVVFVLVLVVQSDAWEEYQSRFPNAKNVYINGKQWKAVGHTSSGGKGNGAALDNFGKEFYREWTIYLCTADSDGDGQTNGHELGDPCCTWKEGMTPNRTTDISHPGKADSMTSAPGCPYEVVAPALGNQATLSLAYCLGAVGAVVFTGLIMNLLTSADKPPSAFLAFLKHKKIAWQPQKFDYFGIPSFFASLSVGEFIAVILYFLSIPLYIAYATPQFEVKFPTDSASRALGYLCMLHMGLVFLPVTRHSLWFRLMGIPFDRAIKFHKLFSYVLIALMFSHFVIEANAARIDGHLGFLIRWIPDGNVIYNAPGLIAGAGFILILLSSLNRVRRAAWETFKNLHIILSVIVIAFSVFHVYQLGFYLIPGVALFLLDFALRMRARSRSCEILEWKAKETVTKLVVKCPPNFTYSPGHYVAICIPAISESEFHFMTIASSPGWHVGPERPSCDTLTLYIKGMGTGTWSHTLAQQNLKGSLAHIEGPYGHISVNYLAYPHVLLICGGIGVTPMLAVAKYLSEKQVAAHESAPKQNVTLVWSVRDQSTLDLILPALSAISGASPNFQVLLFITGKETGLTMGGEDKFVDLNATVTAGRPDYAKILTNMKEGCKGTPSAVCMMACGPTALVNSCRAAQDQISCSTLRVDFHKEEFDL